MAVNKVAQSNGTTLIDISPTTAVESDVASGKVFYLADGTQATGRGGGGYTRIEVIAEQTVTPTVQNSQCSVALSESHGIFVAGGTYIVTFNGVEYWYTCQNVWSTFLLVGDLNYLWGTSAQPYPFALYDGNDVAKITLLTHSGNGGIPVTIKVEKFDLA